MNAFLRALMDKPSPSRVPWCPVCGTTAMKTTGHHMVPRSQGGLSGPVIYLCGHGTVGCHGEAEDGRLHFRWEDERWLWLHTSSAIKYEAALELGGWVRVVDFGLTDC